MSDLTRVEDLAQRVADGLADEAMIAELEALMSDDASARLAYLQTLQLHQDLERKSARGTLGGDQSEVDTTIEFPVAPSRWVSPLLSAAAVLMVGVIALVWSAGRVGVDEVGEIVEVSEAVWQGEAPKNALQRDQRLRLASGSVELRLASGVRVVLEGEVDVVLGSAMDISLLGGQLFAAVPRNARGFRVATLEMEVIDLGTQFGVRVGESGADVHVFEGEVEVAPGTGAAGRQTLTTAQAARFDPQGRLEDWIAPDYQGFSAPLSAPGVVSTSKAVHWLENPPSTFGFTDEKAVALVLERQNVLLPQPLDVTFDRHKRGSNSAYDSHRRVLEAGTRVDSYLMHFNPRQPSGKGPGGGVQFDRPIIGVIARGDQLIASDAVLGLADLDYPEDSARGLEGRSDALDVFRMERDQIWVAFSGAERGLDQVRILLEARSPTLLQALDENDD